MADASEYPLLNSLDLPGDLHDLDDQSIADLSDEMRSYMLDIVSQTGGHLSPNLGVVELSIALHKAFHSPQDRIIWDVGHQAYAHKLLTGRSGDFPGLRQTAGLSGYPSRDESPHDIVENSHASTSLSYALGFALSRRADDDSYIVAVIEFEKGVRTTGQVIDCEPEDVRIGMKVTSAFRKIGEDGKSGVIYYGYKFKPA